MQNQVLPVFAHPDSLYRDFCATNNLSPVCGPSRPPVFAYPEFLEAKYFVCCDPTPPVPILETSDATGRH